MAHLLDDACLTPYEGEVRGRAERADERAGRLMAGTSALHEAARRHFYFGLHRIRGGWVFREWAPNATGMFLVGDFNGWRKDKDYEVFRIPGTDVWERHFPAGKLKHLDRYHLLMEWEGGSGERIPAYARYVTQDEETKLFSSCVWQPRREYKMKNPSPRRPKTPLIYEAHIGMAGEEARVHTYAEFKDEVLPRIKRLGYNTVQLMGIMEHPYYGSFGYHVSSFFAPSSRFGTPDELKALIDAAHGMGISVIMDLVHSHAVANERDGLSRFDGTLWQYFHAGARGVHPAWGSRCFDYGKDEVVLFLLSNCRYWLEEFGFDGFRFDGVTSMLFHDHGLGVAFTDYSKYFCGSVDEDAWAYLRLANRVIHETKKDALTIAEDVSGLPGVAAPQSDCGIGFDYRMAMGEPDYWFKLAEKVPDDDWPMGGLFYALTDKRSEEKVVSYVESHDQALVGGKTFFFQLVDSEIYWGMRRDQENLAIERGIALHKMARLATFALNGGAYLNFMGNEFGHPEWIDFPRAENGWDYSHARRQWSLAEDDALRFSFLQAFDSAMLSKVKATEGNAVLLAADEGDKVLAFARGDFLFAFNFHHSASYADYGIMVPPAAKYRHLFDTDEVRFGGQGRIRKGTLHEPYLVPARGELVQQIRLYLPSRTAIVLKRVRN